MEEKTPKISIDILIVKDNKILLGLLSKDWMYEGNQVYGLPGREIKFRENIGEAVKRNIEEEIGCTVVTYKVISVNANYAFDNHYIGIGVLAEISGDVKRLKPNDWDTWEWFDKSELPKNLFPAACNVLQSYLENKITVSE